MQSMGGDVGLLTTEDLWNVRDKALAAGLAGKRDSLIAWFPPAVQAYLPGGTSGITAYDALTRDLGALNDLDEPGPDGLYLVRWLRQASALCGPRAATQAFFAEMADTAARNALALPTGIAPAADSPAGAADGIVIPEKILFRSTLLPDSFIGLAALRARSVARLTVPRFEAGSPIMTAGGQPAGVYGTGWMIGPRHLITNWHVVRARSSGEADPVSTDVEAQVAHATIEFDYVSDTVPAMKAPPGALVHGNPALDYAVIAFAEAVGREPLPLRGADIEIDPDNPFAANVIQHPGGAPRQYAIRNNLAAVRQGNDLAYFTDTAGGSSGSPVCDDDWLVVALHKASTPKFGEFSFQGKKTTWVNVGTLITAIVADLRDKAPALWASAGASIR
jgi:endonuclease G